MRLLLLLPIATLCVLSYMYIQGTVTARLPLNYIDFVHTFGIAIVPTSVFWYLIELEFFSSNLGETLAIKLIGGVRSTHTFVEMIASTLALFTYSVKYGKFYQSYYLYLLVASVVLSFLNFAVLHTSMMGCVERMYATIDANKKLPAMHQYRSLMGISFSLFILVMVCNLVLSYWCTTGYFQDLSPASLV